LIAPVHAQEQLAKLVPPGASDSDLAGWCVSALGNTAAVGAWQDVVSGIAGGSVCVYRREGTAWFVDQLLTASDAAGNDNFGYSVAVGDDVILVGAIAENHQGLPNAGAAYVFRRSGVRWVEEQKLVASDGAKYDAFGSSAAIAGDVAVVGAMFEDHDGLIDPGAAYVFRRSASGWVEEQKLTAFESGPEFGRAVSVLGDSILAGAPECTGAATTSGAVFAYRWTGTTWVLEQKFFASEGETADFFGVEISLSGDRALVGSPAFDTWYARGAAYVFRRTAGQWVQEAKLTEPIPHLDGFGGTVSLYGETAIVGGGSDGQGFGQALVFRAIGTEWPLVQTLEGKDSLVGDSFGCSVALTGDTAVAGALNADDQGVNSGSAFAFALNWDDLGSGLAGASDAPLLLGAGALAPGQRIWLSLSKAPPFAPTMIVIGASALNAPFKGGVMVPSPDRIVMVATGGDGHCDLQGLWPSPWPSGLELFFQAWSVDPAAPVGFAASNAVSSTSP
jgi:hypothetical protein